MAHRLRGLAQGLALAALVIGVGCQPLDLAGDMQRELDAAVAQASQMADPLQRYDFLGQAEARVLGMASGVAGGVCGTSTQKSGLCLQVRAFGTSGEVRRRALQEALKQGDFRAVRIEWKNMSPEQKRSLMQTIVGEAVEDSNYPSDKLRWAAERLYAGDVMMRDTHLAYSFMGRAWRQGDIGAAARAAAWASASNDPINAYFWSLRCVSPGCTRENGIALDTLAAALTPEARLQAEAGAKDASLISLPGGVL